MRAILGIVIVTLFAFMVMMHMVVSGGLMDRLIRAMIMIVVVVCMVCDGMDLAMQMMMVIGHNANPAFRAKADKRIANQQDQTQDLA